MTYIIDGPPSWIRTSDLWKNDTNYSPLLFQLSYWWLRVPVRLELTTLRLLGVRSELTELWDLILLNNCLKIFERIKKV